MEDAYRCWRLIYLHCTIMASSLGSSVEAAGIVALVAFIQRLCEVVKAVSSIPCGTSLFASYSI